MSYCNAGNVSCTDRSESNRSQWWATISNHDMPAPLALLAHQSTKVIDMLFIDILPKIESINPAIFER